MDTRITHAEAPYILDMANGKYRNVFTTVWYRMAGYRLANNDHLLQCKGRREEIVKILD
jgi:hypothetical protein